MVAYNKVLLIFFFVKINTQSLIMFPEKENERSGNVLVWLQVNGGGGLPAGNCCSLEKEGNSRPLHCIARDT
jgi:hypothetical protein